MILWTKYLNNSRSCTKQEKIDTEKQWKKFVADAWKIILSLIFNIIESYLPKHLRVYYLWRSYSTSDIGSLQELPFYCKWFVSIDNSVP